MAEVLCSCFWVKQGLSLQLRTLALLLHCFPFIRLWFWLLLPTVLCSSILWVVLRFTGACKKALKTETLSKSKVPGRFSCFGNTFTSLATYLKELTLTEPFHIFSAWACSQNSDAVGYSKGWDEVSEVGWLSPLPVTSSKLTNSVRTLHIPCTVTRTPLFQVFLIKALSFIKEQKSFPSLGTVPTYKRLRSKASEGCSCI